MNIKELHKQDKEVSALSLFKGETGDATSIQLKENGSLKEHVSKIPALLLCVIGQVVYEDELSNRIALMPGDYVNIIPDIKHKLTASKQSQLVLYK